MAAKSKKPSLKVKKVMHEWKTGTLHSGKGGPVVKSQKQAIAIAMSEAGMKKPVKKKAAVSTAAKKKVVAKSKSMVHSPKGEYKSPAAKRKHEKMEPAKKKMQERKMGRSS